MLLPLAGPVALVGMGMGMGILGAEGWAAFLRGFAQVVVGGASPLDHAQVHLRSFQAYVGVRGLVATLGQVCAKLGARNLLPLATQWRAGAYEPGEEGAACEQAWGHWSLWTSLLLLGG